MVSDISQKSERSCNYKLADGKALLRRYLWWIWKHSEENNFTRDLRIWWRGPDNDADPHQDANRKSGVFFRETQSNKWIANGFFLYLNNQMLLRSWFRRRYISGLVHFGGGVRSTGRLAGGFSSIDQRFLNNWFQSHTFANSDYLSP